MGGGKGGKEGKGTLEQSRVQVSNVLHWGVYSVALVLVGGVLVTVVTLV